MIEKSLVCALNVINYVVVNVTNVSRPARVRIHTYTNRSDYIGFGQIVSPFQFDFANAQRFITKALPTRVLCVLLLLRFIFLSLFLKTTEIRFVSEVYAGGDCL